MTFDFYRSPTGPNLLQVEPLQNGLQSLPQLWASDQTLLPDQGRFISFCCQLQHHNYNQIYESMKLWPIVFQESLVIPFSIYYGLYIKIESRLFIFLTLFFLKVDDEEMDCSGAILSQHSTRLAKIVADNESLDLTPHFTGRADDMYSLLEILYGGKIEISMENMESFMKFGIMFQFPDFCDQVLEFLCREISVSNVIEMFDIGSNMKTLPDKPHNDRILEGCKGFIIGLEMVHISQLMFLLRKSVSRGDDVNPELLEFLFETAQSGPTIESHPLPWNQKRPGMGQMLVVWWWFMFLKRMFFNNLYNDSV